MSLILAVYGIMAHVRDHVVEYDKNTDLSYLEASHKTQYVKPYLHGQEISYAKLR